MKNIHENCHPGLCRDESHSYNQMPAEKLSELRELLEDYSNWLHKNNYMDSDYYTEEPLAIDTYLESFVKKIKSRD